MSKRNPTPDPTPESYEPQGPERLDRQPLEYVAAAAGIAGERLPGIISQRYEERVDIATLIEHPANPRRGDVEAIEESIRRNDFYGAVVVQESTRYVVVGNHRRAAAERVGITHLPALIADMDDRTALRILLADNRTNDLATYDEHGLKALLEELAANTDEEEPLAGTGYTREDLGDLVAKLEPPTLEDLEEAYGDEPAEDAFWPVIRLKVDPDTKDRFDGLLEDAPGRNEAEKLASILMCVDSAALAEVTPPMIGAPDAPATPVAKSKGGKSGKPSAGKNMAEREVDDILGGAGDWEPDDGWSNDADEERA